MKSVLSNENATGCIWDQCSHLQSDRAESCRHLNPPLTKPYDTSCARFGIYRTWERPSAPNPITLSVNFRVGRLIQPSQLTKKKFRLSFSKTIKRFNNPNHVRILLQRIFMNPARYVSAMRCCEFKWIFSSYLDVGVTVAALPVDLRQNFKWISFLLFSL